MLSFWIIYKGNDNKVNYLLSDISDQEIPEIDQE